MNFCIWCCLMISNSSWDAQAVNKYWLRQLCFHSPTVVVASVHYVEPDTVTLQWHAIAIVMRNSEMTTHAQERTKCQDIYLCLDQTCASLPPSQTLPSTKACRIYLARIDEPPAAASMILARRRPYGGVYVYQCVAQYPDIGQIILAR